MLRTTTVWQGGIGAPYYNQLYFAGVTEGEANAAAAAARQFWGGLSNVIAAGETGLVNAEVEVVDPATGQVTATFQTTTTGMTGSASGESLPPANQGLARLLTNSFVNGRRVRGRVFIPSPTEAQALDGAPATAYVSFVNSALADLLSFGEAAGNLVVYSPTHRISAVVTDTSVWTSAYAVLRSRRD